MCDAILELNDTRNTLHTVTENETGQRDTMHAFTEMKEITEI